MRRAAQQLQLLVVPQFLPMVLGAAGSGVYQQCSWTGRLVRLTNNSSSSVGYAGVWVGGVPWGAMLVVLAVVRVQRQIWRRVVVVACSSMVAGELCSLAAVQAARRLLLWLLLRLVLMLLLMAMQQLSGQATSV
jgi:hypothetical protein